MNIANARSRGFTIVELLIVIVVIGILATVSVVAYNGINNKARISSLQTDLKNAEKQLEIDKTMGATYPVSVDVANGGKGLVKSSGTNFQYSQLSSGAGYCLTATSDSSGVGPFSISSGSGLRSGTCSGHDYGHVAPAGVNIAAPITTWTLPASVSVNGDAIQFPAVSGGSVSTLLKVDEAKSVLISFDTKALATGSRSVWSSGYYASNKTTSVSNTTGHTGNGCAYSGTTVGAWEGKSCSFTLGPGIIYLRLYLSTTSTYSGPTEIRNVSVTLTR